MKRSLTIGCVLLVGGGVTNCGGSAEVDHEPGAEAGSAAVAGHFVGTITQGGNTYVGDYMGSPVEISGAGGVGGTGRGYVGAGSGNIGAMGVGGAVGVGPLMGTAGAPDVGAGAGGELGELGASGTSGTSDEPPGVGTAPLGGTGGFVGIPPR